MGSICSKQTNINVYIIQQLPLKTDIVFNKNDCILNDEVVLGLSDDSLILM